MIIPIAPALFRPRSKHGLEAIAGRKTKRIPGENSIYAGKLLSFEKGKLNIEKMIRITVELKNHPMKFFIGTP